MTIYPQERIALFIDGSNLYAAARALGFDIDFRLLRSEFMRRGRMVRAFYYTALLESEDYTPINARHLLQHLFETCSALIDRMHEEAKNNITCTAH